MARARSMPDQSARARRKPLSDEANILRTADDWCFLFDEDNGSLEFPSFIAETNLRTDAVITQELSNMSFLES